MESKVGSRDRHPLERPPLCPWPNAPALGRCDKWWRQLEWASHPRMRMGFGPITMPHCSPSRPGGGPGLGGFDNPLFLKLGKGGATWIGLSSLHRAGHCPIEGADAVRDASPIQPCYAVKPSTIPGGREAFTRRSECRIEAVGSFEEAQGLSAPASSPSAGALLLPSRCSENLGGGSISPSVCELIPIVMV